MSLAFNDERHEYRYSGTVVPGVTSLIERAYDFSNVPDSIMEYKSALGKAVHKACELEDLGTLDESTVATVVLPYLSAYRKFKAEAGYIEWHGIEERVYHPVHRYAGTLDRRGWIGGDYGIADLKTSSTVHKACGLQLAGYQEAHKGDPDLHVKKPDWKRWVIHLKPDGKYQLVPFNDPMDWPTFVSCLTWANWKAKNG